MSLLIVTDSRDYTTDLLMHRLDAEKERVFRFNVDLIHDYRLELTPSSFRIVDPLGRVADSERVTKLYWRKPLPRAHRDADPFFEAELWQAVKALVRLCWDDGKVVLVEPLCESTRLDKLRQLRIAAQFFDVPPTAVVCGQTTQSLPSDVVVKSLSGETIGNKRLFTTRVEQAALSTRHLWFMQTPVAARFDLTVVCVREQQFAFAFDRGTLGATPDWRADPQHHDAQHWRPVTLPSATQAAIANFMTAARLHYARIDFLWDGEHAPTFCEVNPNGQFAWLDLDNTRGVMDAVVDAISPATSVVALSMPASAAF